MNKNKARLALATLALAMLVPGQSAFAGFSDGVAVTMGGKQVFRVLSGADGFSAEHRAWLAQDALDNALVLSSDLSPSAVTVGKVNGACVVMVGGRTVATADAASAAAENLSPENLTAQWAESIKNFLSDSAQTDRYRSSLTGKNPVEASVAVIERRLYAPAGLAFKVHLSQNISAADIQSGEVITAVVDSDVPVGSYVIPSGSTVLGTVVENDAHDYTVSFHSLRTPSGTEVPIHATVSSSYVVSNSGAHSVCTYVIPAGSANGMPGIVARVPASVGIGLPGSGSNTLVLRRGIDVLAANRPMTLVLDAVTPVAVISRDTAM